MKSRGALSRLAIMLLKAEYRIQETGGNSVSRTAYSVSRVAKMVNQEARRVGISNISTGRLMVEQGMSNVEVQLGTFVPLWL